MASGGIGRPPVRSARPGAAILAVALLLGAAAWAGLGTAPTTAADGVRAAPSAIGRVGGSTAVVPASARPPVVSRPRPDRPGPVTTGAASAGLIVLLGWMAALAARTPDRGRTGLRSALRTRAPPVIAA